MTPASPDGPLPAADALVMCGGEGSRLDAPCEKPLFELAGRTMVDRVVDALRESAADRVYAAVSPATPETAAHLRDAPAVTVVETSGEGYVADLGDALATTGTPTVTVAADLPLLAPGHVDRALGAAAGDPVAGSGSPAGSPESGDADASEPPDADAGVDSLAVLAPVALKHRLGVSVDEIERTPGWVPTGLNVVGDAGGDREWRCWDARLAVNVNRKRDADAAEALSTHGP